jgi:PHD/YefM family antitoxin component YafN of YafNO toxin-antitoxin module
MPKFKTITLQEIKSRGSKALDSSEPLYLIVNSKPKYVIMSVEEYEARVEYIEDLEDSLDIIRSKDDPTVDARELFAELEKQNK